jgi:hypothetical protein
LRFQPAGCGSHTSKRISESADGLLTPRTRQNDGRLGIVRVSEIVRLPGVTSVDSTIEVPLSKVRPASAEHSTAWRGAGAGRSGTWAATPMTHARIAAPTKNDARFGIMTRSLQ